MRILAETIGTELRCDKISIIINTINVCLTSIHNLVLLRAVLYKFVPILYESVDTKSPCSDLMAWVSKSLSAADFFMDFH